MAKKFIVKTKPEYLSQLLLNDKPESKGQKKKAQLAAEGKRWVDFVVPIDTWSMFVAYCEPEKPGDVLNSMIETAVNP